MNGHAYRTHFANAEKPLDVNTPADARLQMTVCTIPEIFEDATVRMESIPTDKIACTDLMFLTTTLPMIKMC